MTIHNRIQGTFRLTSPLHCASPDENLVKDSKLKGSQTPTTQQNVLTKAGIQRVPYFPGNDLRGRLRRKAAALVLDRITASGGKVTPELYSGLTTGAITSSPDANLTVEEALRAQSNVYMGLFGGGARLLRSRFQASDLIPVLASTIEVGMVPERFGSTDDQHFLPVTNKAVDAGSEKVPLQGWQLVQVTNVLRVDDLHRVLRPSEVEAYIENAATVVAAIQQKNLEGRKARKDSKAQAEAGEIGKSEVSSKLETGNMMSFQSIIAGTPMHCLFDLDNDVTDAHVGLMLLSLQALVREQKLGGWCRAGLGRFDADLTLTRDGERIAVFSSDRAGADAELSAHTQPFVDAAIAEISQLTEAQMMEFFKERETETSTQKKADKVAQKTGAAV